MVSAQHCPLCNASQSALFDQREFRGSLVSNRLCTQCGLVFQSPRKSDQELADFYVQEYRQLYQGSQGPNPKDLSVQTGRARSLLSFSQGFISGLQRHLDIGCSAGLLLQHFETAYGCQPVGIEPGEAYRVYAQEQGLQVYATIEELAAKEGISKPLPFDLVSLAHVCEHLPDPVGYLSTLRASFLSPDGWLLVEVPNLYGHDCFEVAHLVSFSPHTLKQTLQKAGFQVQASLVHGRPRSASIPLYLTMLAKPIKENDQAGSPYRVEPESGVRRKRRLAMLRRKLVTRLAPRKAWLPI